MTDVLKQVLRPSPDAAESAVGGETVILHLVNGTYYGLDVMGTRVWEMLKEGIGNDEICARIAADFGIDQSVVEADVRAFLGDLKAQDIVIDS